MEYDSTCIWYEYANIYVYMIVYVHNNNNYVVMEV